MVMQDVVLNNIPNEGREAGGSLNDLEANVNDPVAE
jgi:hypothetical protein